MIPLLHSGNVAVAASPNAPTVARKSLRSWTREFPTVNSQLNLATYGDCAGRANWRLKRRPDHKIAHWARSGMSPKKWFAKSPSLSEKVAYEIN